MFREACRFFDEQNNIPFKFTGTIDPNWARQDWANRGGILEPGWFVRFSDKDFKPEGYDIRITGMRDYANDEFSAVLELSNDVVVSGKSTEFARIAGERQRLDRERAGLQDLNSRTFADAVRTAQMLINAGLEGFSESIQPITIQTMQALIGATELQFTITRPNGNRAQQFWDNQQRRLIGEAGVLVHHTLGIDFIAEKPDNSKLSRWNIGEFQSPQNLDSNAFYLYARCEKEGTSATYHLSEPPLPMDDGNHWNFLVGILNPEIGDNRVFAPMNGFTLIEPGRIVVNRLQSSDFNPETGQGMAVDLEHGKIITSDLVVKSKGDNGVNMLLEGLLGITQGGTSFENIVAAISGRSDDRVGIVIHRNGEYDTNPDALQRAIDFLHYNDELRRPNLAISKEGRISAVDANLTGHIEAQTGRIAGFDIDGNVLIGGSLVGDNIMVSPRSIGSLGTLTDMASDTWVYAGSRQSNFLSARGFSEQSPGGRELFVINMDSEETISGNAVGNVTRWAQLGAITIGGQVRINPASLGNISNNVIPNVHQNWIRVRLDGIRLRNSAGQTFIIPSNDVGVSIPGGFYTIEGQINYQWTPDSDRDVQASVQFRVNTRFEILQKSNINTARLHTNGIAVVQNSTNFFYYSTTHGLEIRAGDTGFVVNSQGARVRNRNTGAWSNLPNQ